MLLKLYFLVLSSKLEFQHQELFLLACDLIFVWNPLQLDFIYLFILSHNETFDTSSMKASAFQTAHICGVTGPGSAGLNLSRQLRRGCPADRYDLHVSACGVNTGRYVTAGTIRYWRQASSIKDSPTLEKPSREKLVFVLHLFIYLFSWFRGMAGVELPFLAVSLFVFCCFFVFFASGRYILGWVWNTQSRYNEFPNY